MDWFSEIAMAGGLLHLVPTSKLIGGRKDVIKLKKWQKRRMALTLKVIAVYMAIDRSFIVQFPSNGSSNKKRTDRRKKTAPNH